MKPSHHANLQNRSSQTGCPTGTPPAHALVGPLRTDLTGEHALTDVGRLVLAALFFAGWIANLFFRQLTMFANHVVPIVVRVPTGALLLVLAAFLALGSHRIIFEETRETARRATRCLRGVRHPMYVSEILH